MDNASDRLPLLLVGAFESKDSSRMRFLAPQLGVERLAAHVRNNDIDVKTIDPNIDSEEAFQSIIKNESPLIVGFSLSYMTLINDLSLIYYVIEHSPESLIIAGGQQATFDYGNLLRIAPIDMILLGEGEFPLLELVQKKISGEDIWGINGSVYKKDDKVVRIGNTQPLNSGQFIAVTLGLDFNRINYRKYWDELESFYEEPNYYEIKTIRLFTVNYCPMQCTFCSSRSFQNAAKGSVDTFFNPKGKVTKLAGLDPENMVLLITNALKAYPDTHTFYLQEDEHTLLKNRVENFCKLVIEKKKNGQLPEYLRFMCQARVEDVSYELLVLMKSAGYSMISYGVESFSDRVLASIKKRNTTDDIYNALESTIKVGIKPFVNLMVFIPEVTLSEILDTVDNALDYVEHGVEVATEPFVMPLPGSYLYYDTNLDKYSSDVQIPGTDYLYERVHFVIPQDEEVRGIAFQFYEHHEAYMKEVVDQYKFEHLPTRLRSLITFHGIMRLIGDTERMKRIEGMFESFSGDK